MSLIRETLQAYGVDLHICPIKPRILIPDLGEREGIIVEQFLKDDTGEYIVSNEEIVTGMVFFPEPDTETGEEEQAEEPGTKPLTLEQIKAEPLRKFTCGGKEMNYIGVKMGLRFAIPFAKEATEEELFQSIYGPCYWENNK